MVVVPGSLAPRPRRYGIELEEAIYSAVFDELIDVGFSRLNFDNVAKRAGTGKAAIYRRWRSTSELVVDAFSHEIDTKRPPFVPTGNMRADLLRFLTPIFVDVPEGPAHDAYRALIGEARRSPTPLAAMVDRYWDTGIQTLREIFDHAVASKEIKASAITPEVLEILPGILTSRQLLNRGAVSKRDIAVLVDHIIIPLVGYRPSAAKPKAVK